MGICQLKMKRFTNIERFNVSKLYGRFASPEAFLNNSVAFSLVRTKNRLIAQGATLLIIMWMVLA